ncbi:MAG: TPM domain-containing protein [Bacillota bacterium]
MMKKVRFLGKKILVFLLIVSFVFATGVFAAPNIPPVPNPPGPVNDFAKMLKKESLEQMEAVALALKKASGSELVVVTVENLGGYPIEDYALELFRSWGLGDKSKHNGVLLLINKEHALTDKSGRVRIEVGYGLEGAIPDGKAGRILDEYVLAAWEEKDYDLGIYQGFMAIAALIAEEYQIDLNSDGDLAILGDYAPADDFPFWIILLIFVFVIILNSFIIRNSRKKPRRYSPFDNDHWGGPFIGGGFGGGGGFKGGGFGGGGFGGFGGGSSGGGGASR